jgi:hypothetical protein
MPENTNIEKTFTYNIADQYLYQTNKLKRTASWTYKGPDKLWIFVDETTNKIISRFHYTEADNGHDVPTPIGSRKVLVDANINPDIASLIHNEYNYSELPQYVETLPGGTTYGHSDPIPPDHTYELTEIVHNPSTEKFVKPYPWKQPHVTMDDILQARNAMLSSSDVSMKNALDNDKAAWEEYRQQLRDLPSLYAGIDPWKIPFPNEPGTPGAM